jgi:hypothetical protein
MAATRLGSMSDLNKVVGIEMEIANSAGIILQNSGKFFKPLNGLDLAELSRGAPLALLKDIESRLK